MHLGPHYILVEQHLHHLDAWDRIPGHLKTWRIMIWGPNLWHLWKIVLGLHGTFHELWLTVIDSLPKVRLQQIVIPSLFKAKIVAEDAANRVTSILRIRADITRLSNRAEPRGGQLPSLILENIVAKTSLETSTSSKLPKNWEKPDNVWTGL